MNAFFIHTTAGEPDFLSVKAVNAIMKADLVLVEEKILDDIREFIPCGCRIFDSLSAACKFLGGLNSKTPFNLVRISSDDAIDSERMLNEAYFFSKYGFETEIIPGVSYINAVTASHRFPLTQRGINQSFWVLDCKYRDCSVKLYREIKIAASSTATLVLLNAGENTGELLTLIRRERPGELPVLSSQDNDMMLVGIVSPRLPTYFPAGEYSGLLPLSSHFHACSPALHG